MYFFLSHLSFCDILISTNVTPNALKVILMGLSYVPALCCHAQSFFFGASVMTECCLLSVMSFDRYLAICVPLRYSSIMKHHLPQFLASLCWLVGFTLAMFVQGLILELDFCGPNIIDHFFCDLAPLLENSCSDTNKVEVLVSVIVFIICISQLLFVVVTYICIFTSILQISSISGRQKIFSTCSSHLVIVSTFYGTLITLYMAPTRGYSLNLNKGLSLLNSAITPLLNPIIYSLRNKEIRNAMIKTALNKSLG
ncbi:olfactory receptor 6X1-like [Mantella aurantiaca]